MKNKRVFEHTLKAQLIFFSSFVIKNKKRQRCSVPGSRTSTVIFDFIWIFSVRNFKRCSVLSSRFGTGTGIEKKKRYRHLWFLEPEPRKKNRGTIIFDFWDRNREPKPGTMERVMQPATEQRWKKAHIKFVVFFLPIKFLDLHFLGFKNCKTGVFFSLEFSLFEFEVFFPFYCTK